MFFRDRTGYSAAMARSLIEPFRRLPQLTRADFVQIAAADELQSISHKLPSNPSTKLFFLNFHPRLASLRNSAIAA
jgi:hypothetical protein